MRATIYDSLGIGMLLGSTYFFYRSVEFLAQKDYVSGVLAILIGFIVVRVGVELGRLSIVARREVQDGGA